MLAYLDYAASGPLDPAVAEAMGRWMTDRYGNPSGAHRVAREARAAIENVRDQVGDFLGVEPGGIVFTSGGTEADNLAVLGAAAATPGPVVVSAVEHPAVTEAAHATGREVRVAPVDGDGLIDLEALRPLLDDGVSLVSIQLANHETGVVQPLADIARRVRKWAPNALLHTDAVQAAAWADLRSDAAGADLISISAHKLGGPQGIGVLGARGRPALRPIIHGGGQERQMRSGTPNVVGIVGLGVALEAAASDRQVRSSNTARLRDDLADRILSALTDVVETARTAPRLPGHLHLRFSGVENESLLVLLDEAGVCASAGAACASGALEPSPVLLAMGVDKDDAKTAVRFTVGWRTSPAEIHHAAAAAVAAVLRLRGWRR